MFEKEAYKVVVDHTLADLRGEGGSMWTIQGPDGYTIGQSWGDKELVDDIAEHMSFAYEAGKECVLNGRLLREADDEIERLRADLAFYDNKCGRCGDHLGLLAECPHCREIERLKGLLREARPIVADGSAYNPKGVDLRHRIDAALKDSLPPQGEPWP